MNSQGQQQQKATAAKSFNHKPSYWILEDNKLKTTTNLNFGTYQQQRQQILVMNTKGHQ